MNSERAQPDNYRYCPSIAQNRLFSRDFFRRATDCGTGSISKREFIQVGGLLLSEQATQDALILQCLLAFSSLITAGRGVAVQFACGKRILRVIHGRNLTKLHRRRAGQSFNLTARLRGLRKDVSGRYGSRPIRTEKEID